MATYDKAHELARELKSSEEYKEYQKAKQAIMNNSSAMSILRDFQKMQIEAQMDLLNGKEPDAKKQDERQKISDIVSMHGEVKRFLDAERAILVIMSDIQKILTEALNLLDYP